MLLVLAGCNQKQNPVNNQEQKPDNREITGTVYIMTAGAETIRLPMVQIVAFDIATNDAVKIIDAERQTAEQKLNEDGKSLLAHYAVVELDRITIEDSREAHNVGTNLDNSFRMLKQI
jgi:hypothetical protein